MSKASLCCQSVAKVHSPFASNTFEFRVEDQRFHVHLELLERHSKPLYTLATVDMKEKEQGYAILQGVNIGTISRFCEWVYTGSYSLPDPEIETTMKDGKESKRITQTAMAIALVELYVFAESRDIQALKTGALDRLIKELLQGQRYPLVPKSYDLSQVLKSIYSHTTRAEGEELEPLRAFAMRFCGIFSLDSLVKNDGLKEVLRTSEVDLLTDFMCMLGKKNFG